MEIPEGRISTTGVDVGTQFLRGCTHPREPSGGFGWAHGAGSYVCEPHADGWARYFARFPGNRLWRVTLPAGVRLLDLRGEVEHVKDGPRHRLQFVRRPAITDALSGWCGRPFDQAINRLESTAWARWLIAFVSSIGLGGLRLADEVVLAPNVAFESIVEKERRRLRQGGCCGEPSEA